MKLKMFEKEVNLELFYQFKEMILNLSEEDYGKSSINSTVLGFEKPAISLQTAYNLKYPGEVLERYAEKGLDDKRSVRALMMALTECLPAMQPRMFVDKQLPNFLKHVKESANSDLYLICSLLQWENDADQKLELCAKFSSTASASDAAWLYALGYIRNLPEGWDMIEERLAYMFMFHNIDVYSNTDVIVWLQKELAFEILKSRKVCAKILKIFINLQKHWLKLDSKDFIYLKSLGYTEQEVIYIAMYTSKCWQLTKEVIGYRSMQKILVNGCSYYLSAKVIESCDIIDMCVRCLNDFPTLLQCIECQDRVCQVIGKISIGTHEMFNAVWNNVRSSYRLKEWFYVDILEPEWDNLLNIVGPREYRDIAEVAMFKHTENLQDYILRYNDVCKSDYRRDMLMRSTNNSLAYVDDLQAAGIIDIYTLIDLCATNIDKATKPVKDYVAQYISFNVQKKLECWKWVVRKYDVETLSKITSVNGFVSGIIGVYKQGYNYSYNFNSWFQECSDKDKLLLFGWSVRELYLFWPESYVKTMANVFIHYDMSFMPNDDMIRICDSLYESPVLSQNVKLDLIRVMKPEEYETAKEAAEEARKQKALDEQQAKIQNWNEEILDNIETADDPADAIIKAFGNYQRYNTGYSSVCLKILIENQDKFIFTEDNIEDICCVLADLISDSKVPEFNFDSYKEIINSLGVIA